MSDMRNGGRGGRTAVGVRERNRRALRRRLSDTATAMFLEHGFDQVRVSDVAQASGVSTKTVWNHFPTKESLLLDRGDRLATALGEPIEDTEILDIVLACIETEIEELYVDDATVDDATVDDATVDDATVDDRDSGRDHDPLASVQAFVRLVETHQGLREAAAGRFELLVRQAADALATQTGTPASSPHNQILAGALISLWRLHLSALLKAADQSLPPRQVQDYVRQQVHEGAELVTRLM